MSFTRSDVLKVSLLARLDLSADEIDKMTAQLAAVVGYVEQLGELNTDDVEPMAHALDICNAFADDVEAPCLPRDVALANAPRQDGEFYLVPAVLGE